MPEEENKCRRRREAQRPRASEAWQRLLRWRRFVWLPSEIEITVAGKEREERTAERDEGRREEGARTCSSAC